MTPYKQNAGMTLIELMISVAIVGILASIAVPGYRAYVIRANRAEAKTALMAAAGALERCYTMNRTYAAGAGCAVPDAFMSETGKYRITVDVRDANAFTLTATPQGAQANDTKCANFGLTQTNERKASGSYGAAECWSR